ncbi:CinY protein [Streptomyces sp. NPDC050636]|uniref:CinY protein n=1 Tax=Streptomyces sp. NPDC050636 TaxID=3154510 RepID=UPI003416386B
MRPARESRKATRHQRCRKFLAIGAAVVASQALLVLGAQPAGAFGTVNTLGQNSEHERITRAALSCPPGTSSDGACFEPRSIDQLAGHTGTFGAVGAPDSDEILTPTAHCDNADYLDVKGYPRSRGQASDTLRNCIAHLQKRLREGVTAAGGTLDAEGGVPASEVDLQKDCTYTLGLPGRDKCEAIEGFGRALHGVQDFYSHSNWTDRIDPARPAGLDNPPGLGRSAPSPLLNLTASQPPGPSAIPQQLTTGCFSLLKGCSKRIEHSKLSKDNGLIDPATGATSAPTTARGKVAGNFNSAVQGAITESRQQWKQFRNALTQQYGAQHGERIVCALTHDNAVGDCA